ncbi:MAG: peptidoglycan-binding domain-containing protein [Roseiarcus sp.]
MPEALARTRHDSVLSGEARPGRRAARQGVVAATLRRLRALPARGYAGAALAAVLTGIVLNALTLQHQRHPAPFFAAPRPALEAPPAPAAKAREPTPLAVLPPARPADLGSGGEASAGARGVDAIGEILREEAGKEAQKPVLAAQNALIRLGYSLAADGTLDAATSAALRDFERAHSLPASIDVTPRLLKQLNAAANASGR